MVKKTMVVLCLCVVALSCAFAGKSSLVLQASPFSYQNVSVSSTNYKSTYGFGFKAGYRYEVIKNLTVGADVDLNLYDYNELDNKYVVVGMRAAGAYAFDFSDAFYGKAGLGFGVAIRAIGSKSQAAFDMQADFDLGYRLSERLSITAGTDLELGFQKGKNSKSTDFAVKVETGVEIKL